MTSRKGIYFVGGASGSGKSTATTELAREYGVPRLELDKLYNRLDFLPDDALRVQTMNTATETLLRELVFAGADMIVEGGWMWPTIAARLAEESADRFCAVFCGYPDASPEARLKFIRAHSGKQHWLASRPEAEALPWIAEQIAGSRKYRQAAETCHLAFFDFTNPQEGNEGLLRHYRDWRRKA